MTEVPTKNRHIKPANSAIIINLFGLMQVNIIVNEGENETLQCHLDFLADTGQHNRQLGC